MTMPPGLRWVAGQLMDKEQFRMEGWHRVGAYWEAGSLEQLRTYGRLVGTRRRAAWAEWDARKAEDIAARERIENSPRTFEVLEGIRDVKEAGIL